MTLEELRKEVPELENYLKYMPKELEQRYWIKTYAPGVIIHQKDYELEYFGIIDPIDTYIRNVDDAQIVHF